MMNHRVILAIRFAAARSVVRYVIVRLSSVTLMIAVHFFLGTSSSVHVVLCLMENLDFMGLEAKMSLALRSNSFHSCMRPLIGGLRENVHADFPRYPTYEPNMIYSYYLRLGGGSGCRF